MMIKIKFIIYFIFLFFFNKVDARTYKLDYEPKGLIIEILYGNLKIYTDTSTIFEYYKEDEDILINIKKCIGSSNNDTITFAGELYDTNKKTFTYANWYGNDLFIHLIKINKIKIINSNNVNVRTIKIKQEGCRLKRESIIRNYIDKDTKEYLFYEWISLKIIDRRYL